MPLSAAIELSLARPEENWLPVERGDNGIDAIMGVYAPDPKRFDTRVVPKAKNLTGEVG